MTDLTPRQAILSYLGGDPVDPHVLRSSVAQVYYGLESVFEIDQYDKSQLKPTDRLSTMSLELLVLQSAIDDYVCDRAPSAALSDLCRARRSEISRSSSKECT
ncbi:hypothetical protein [Pararhizobium sp.]|uniref:hypothetical protein n=1 Tax=Pararhizobium sp. TaxID=1977563 RepID=UPI003D0EE4A9